MASKRNVRRKACGRKQRHADEEAAWAKIRYIRRQPTQFTTHQLHAYLCPHCGFWHIGHRQHQPAEAEKGLCEVTEPAFNAWFGTYPATVTEHDHHYSKGSHVVRGDVLLTLREANGLLTTMSGPATGTLIFVAPLRWLVWPGQVAALVEPDNPTPEKHPTRQHKEVQRAQVAMEASLASPTCGVAAGDDGAPLAVAEHATDGGAGGDGLEPPYPPSARTLRETYRLPEMLIEHVRTMAVEHGLQVNGKEGLLPGKSELAEVALDHFARLNFAEREAVIDRFREHAGREHAPPSVSEMPQ